MEDGDFCLFDKNEFVEILQYTGLKDKTGKEIYEGDIVKFYIESQGAEGVDSSTTIIEEVMFCDCEIYPFCELSDNQNFEIIGNIYENPDLLQDKIS